MVFGKVQNLIKQLLHLWHAKKSNFAKAIVYSEKTGTNKKLVWYYYRLGMYETVCKLKLEKPFSIETIFAKIISCAACGRHDEARNFLKLFLKNSNHVEYKVDLADALSPYIPENAFKLLDKNSAPVTLYLALLLKMGKLQEAKSLSEELMGTDLFMKFPELYLYRSNSLEEISSSSRLEYMNSFLKYFNLGEIVLKHKEQSLSTNNIKLKKECTRYDAPLVSVLMTTFETGERLNTAIESVLGQSYKNLELYIVDDASSDMTSNIISAWEEKDCRVKYIQLNQNVGTYVAKNIALLQCKGEFVTCHDSDDWSHPLKLQMQVEPLLTDYSLIATISSWIRLDDEGLYYARPVHPLMRMNPSSLLFRREKVLQYAGVWDCVRTGADSEFIARLRLVFGRKKVKKIAKPLSFGAHRNDSLMNASSTGYCELGMSPQRLRYWENWNSWHINELKKNKKPFLSRNILAPRVFDAPESIIVPSAKIATLLSWLGKAT